VSDSREEAERKPQLSELGLEKRKRKWEQYLLEHINYASKMQLTASTKHENLLPAFIPTRPLSQQFTPVSATFVSASQQSSCVSVSTPPFRSSLTLSSSAHTNFDSVSKDEPVLLPIAASEGRIAVPDPTLEPHPDHGLAAFKIEAPTHISKSYTDLALPNSSFPSRSLPPSHTSKSTTITSAIQPVLDLPDDYYGFLVKAGSKPDMLGRVSWKVRQFTLIQGVLSYYERELNVPPCKRMIY
jgi:hypothetical protein